MAEVGETGPRRHGVVSAKGEQVVRPQSLEFSTVRGIDSSSRWRTLAWHGHTSELERDGALRRSLLGGRKRALVWFVGGSGREKSEERDARVHVVARGALYFHGRLRARFPYHSLLLQFVQTRARETRSRMTRCWTGSCRREEGGAVVCLCLFIFSYGRPPAARQGRLLGAL